jgi:predicted DNA-binding transcriptional regulator AlpA
MIDSASLERAAIPAREAAALLGISERHLWTLDATGRVPRPVRLGRAVRWSSAELRDWLAAGGPDREAWEARRQSIAQTPQAKGGRQT